MIESYRRQNGVSNLKARERVRERSAEHSLGSQGYRQQQVIKTLRTGDTPSAIAISPDGRRVYVANARSGTVSVISTETSKPATKVIKIPDRATAIAISPDGARAYVTSLEPGVVSVIDTATSKLLIEPIRIGPLLIALALSPDGSRIYVIKN